MITRAGSILIPGGLCGSPASGGGEFPLASPTLSLDLDEASGNAIDQSANGYDFTHWNDPGQADGVGTGQKSRICVDANNESFKLGYGEGASSILPETHDCTFTWWTKYKTGSPSLPVLSFGFPGGDAEGGFTVTPVTMNSGRMNVDVRGASGNPPNYQTNVFINIADKFVCWVLKFDRSAERIVLKMGVVGTHTSLLNCGWFDTPDISAAGSIGMRDLPANERKIALNAHGYHSADSSCDVDLQAFRYWRGLLTTDDDDEWLYNGGDTARLDSELLTYQRAA